MNGQLLQDAFGHHVWASVVLLDTCAALTPDQLATTVPGTYGSILETLRHLVGADYGYLEVLSPGTFGPFDEEDAADVAGLRAAMAATGPAWVALLETDLDPDQTITRHRDDGSTSSAPLSIRLAQVPHHGTDHRSQVCTALTTLGIEPPEIDAWSYAWKDGRLSETEPQA
ncbi:MAG TPA: DinB family protein [Candidatus Limnocylindrales bacterium]|jgi:uncharacterized damage-inducible protein DinB